MGGGRWQRKGTLYEIIYDTLFGDGDNGGSSNTVALVHEIEDDVYVPVITPKEARDNMVYPLWCFGQVYLPNSHVAKLNSSALCAGIELQTPAPFNRATSNQHIIIPLA